MNKFNENEKNRITEQFTKQMKRDYPNIDTKYVKELIDKWERGKKAKDIIAMFLYPELDKLSDLKRRK